MDRRDLTAHPAGPREILALAIPALGALAADPLLGLLDTALIGRLGAPSLAALGAANALFGLFGASLNRRAPVPARRLRCDP